MSAAVQAVGAWLFSALALAAAPGALAQVDMALHTVAVPVNDRSADERALAKRTGLARVLQRLSGRDDLLARADIQAAFGDIDAYVSSYHYQTRPGPDGVERSELALDIRLDAVTAALIEANVPVWNGPRPRLLLWVAQVDGDERRFVSEGVGDVAALSLAYHLRRLGLPFSFPLFDLSDQSLFPLSAVLRNEAPPLHLFGRYRADSLLSGAVWRLDDGSWRCRMRYQIGSVNDTHVFEDASLDSCLGRLADQVAGTLFRMYTAQRPNSAAFSIHVDIEGVLRFADYLAVVRYLSRLSPVRQARILRVDGDAIRVGLHVVGSGGHDQLRTLLSNDNRMVPLTPRRLGAALAGRYRWRGG